MNRKKFYIIAVIVILINVMLMGCGSKADSITLSQQSLETEESRESVSKTSGDIFVYVSGAVKNPGVYCVDEGARLYQVIDMAGGMTKKAQKDYLNLAEKVEDGQQINILTKKQYKKQTATLNESENWENQSAGNGSEQKININSATAEQLTELSGIGESKAAAIVAYREENGGFSSIEDIKNVSGIGDATFENIKSQITVN